MRPLTNLCLLARKYETDKGGRHLRYGGGDSSICHEYTPVYHDLLWERRRSIKRVLELGINSGASLRMWAEYFPNAEIFGVDCDLRCMVDEPRIHSFMCDLGDGAALRRLRDDLLRSGPFDLIIDDASHLVGHQVLAVQEWPEALNVGGMLIVEDLGLPFQEERVMTLYYAAEVLSDDYSLALLPTEPSMGENAGVEGLFVVTREE